MSRRRPGTPLYLNRTIQQARKEHECHGDCGSVIPANECYIKDSLQVAGNFPGDARTLGALKWHMKCAPLTKALALTIVESAQKEGLFRDKQTA